MTSNPLDFFVYFIDRYKELEAFVDYCAESRKLSGMWDGENVPSHDEIQMWDEAKKLKETRCPID